MYCHIKVNYFGDHQPDAARLRWVLLRGSEDFDPHLLLGDGSNLFGAVVADNNGGEFLGTTLDESGSIGDNRELSSIFTGAGFPPIGDSFDVTLDFTLQPGRSTADV
jgi:hypothetical protein